LKMKNELMSTSPKDRQPGYPNSCTISLVNREINPIFLLFQSDPTGRQ
jgi:hypothetical protein